MLFFVTGATGFVGGPVVARLLAQGHEVRALVRAGREEGGPGGGPDEGPGGSVALGSRAARRLRADLAPFELADEALARLSVREGDVASLAGTRDETLVAGEWVFLHLAAALKTEAGNVLLSQVNVEGTRMALAFAADHGARLFAHVSTAYTCGRPGTVFDADAPVAVTPSSKPFEGLNNAYEASKREAEGLVRACALPTLVLRPSIVVPRPAWHSRHRKGAAFGPLAWAALVTRLARGTPRLRSAGFPECGLNCIDVEDVALGIVGATVDAAEGVGEAHLRSLEKRPVILCAKEETKVSCLIEALRVGLGVDNVVLLGPSHMPEGESTTRELFYNQVGSFFTGYVTQSVRFEDPWFHGQDARDRFGVEARGFTVEELIVLARAVCAPKRTKARTAPGEPDRAEG